MGSVNPSEIRSLVEDVKSNIGVFNSYVDAAIKCSNEVKAKAEILKSYNDKIVSDSEVIDNVFDEEVYFNIKSIDVKNGRLVE